MHGHGDLLLDGTLARRFGARAGPDWSDLGGDHRRFAPPVFRHAWRCAKVRPPELDDLELTVETTDARFRILAASIAILTVAGLLVLLLGPGREAREDLATVEDEITLQRQLTEELLDVMTDQLAVTEQTRQLMADSNAHIQQQVELTERLLALTEQLVAADTDDLLREALEVAREILQVARETRDEVRELNQSFPSQPGQTAPLD
jgi:hypothetical protein